MGWHDKSLLQKIFGNRGEIIENRDLIATDTKHQQKHHGIIGGPKRGRCFKTIWDDYIWGATRCGLGSYLIRRTDGEPLLYRLSFDANIGKHLAKIVWPIWRIAAMIIVEMWAIEV